MQRKTVDVEGVKVSYLTSDEPGKPLLLLHGTYWSRVWQPVIDRLARSGLEPVAVDFPGCGFSEGELQGQEASVPALAQWLVKFTQAMGWNNSIYLAAHDIGGGVAQQVLADGKIKIEKMALMNAVMFDSWPVPAVKKFRDPEFLENLSHEEFIRMRRQGVVSGIQRTLSAGECDEYVAPWYSLNRFHSWISMAAEADSKYTMAIVPKLRESHIPKLLIWGEDDP
ncbi:alpha/beta fold hydrolase [Serratia marcescens]|uniref:alpha/beta fold hydrolase n=1 Tax=Serratia marcescens TaxID=615 RepID=UPI003A8360B7